MQGQDLNLRFSAHEADEITRLLYPAIYIIPHYLQFVKKFFNSFVLMVYSIYAHNLIWHSTKFATLCPFSYELLHFIGLYITLAPWYITHSIWRLSLFIYCFDYQSLIVYSKSLDGSWGWRMPSSTWEPSLNAIKNRWLIRLQPWLAGLACLAV